MAGNPNAYTSAPFIGKPCYDESSIFASTDLLNDYIFFYTAYAQVDLTIDGLAAWVDNGPRPGTLLANDSAHPASATLDCSPDASHLAELGCTNLDYSWTYEGAERLQFDPGPDPVTATGVHQSIDSAGDQTPVVRVWCENYGYYLLEYKVHISYNDEENLPHSGDAYCYLNINVSSVQVTFSSDPIKVPFMLNPLVDQSQNIVATVNPASAISNIVLTYTGTAGDIISSPVVDATHGTITFKIQAVGYTIPPTDTSPAESDHIVATNTANTDPENPPCGSAVVHVIGPTQIQEPLDTPTFTINTPKNAELDLSTTPPADLTGQPNGSKLMCTPYQTEATVVVLDQYGDILDSQFDGAVVEEQTENGWKDIHRILSGGSYKDWVGPVATGGVSATPAVLAAFLTASTIPLSPANLPTKQAISLPVRVGGNLMNPGLTDRGYTFTTNATSGTVTVTVSQQ